MVNINHYKEKEFKVNMENGAGFTEDIAHELSKQVVPLLGDELLFIIDFKGFKHISSKGFNVLFDLFKQANAKRSKLVITNVEDEVNELVDTLTVSK